MKLPVVVLCVCLLITGIASALPADSVELGVTKVNSDIWSGIYTSTLASDCSDDSASVGTPLGMGDLNVDSIPDGAAIYLDGTRLTYKHCTGGFPPVCFKMLTFTPYVTNVETGTHSISIVKDGYKSYNGTVKICSQKVSYVKKTLTLIPTTTTTTPTTTVTTTVTTATAAVTTAVTASATSAAATAAATTASPATGTATATATGTAAVTAAITGPGQEITAAGTGSLSVITTPAGAAIYLDGIQRGVSPAAIPGLEAGNHMILLRLQGYQDLSAPVSVTAGTTSEFSTGLTPVSAGAATAPETTAPASLPAAATSAKSPGFEAACGLCALGALLAFRK
jgi:hypothetical protein